MFWHTFFSTIGGMGLLLALAAILLAVARRRNRASSRTQLFTQSWREKTLHLENIQLRRRIGWLERRLPVPLDWSAPAPAPDDSTEAYPAIRRP